MPTKPTNCMPSTRSCEAVRNKENIDFAVIAYETYKYSTKFFISVGNAYETYKLYALSKNLWRCQKQEKHQFCCYCLRNLKIFNQILQFRWQCLRCLIEPWALLEASRVHPWPNRSVFSLDWRCTSRLVRMAGDRGSHEGFTFHWDKRTLQERRH